MRHRPVQACVVALLSALVTACALMTPLQQRAIDQASAHVQLGRASDSARVLQLESSGFVSSYYTGGGQPARALTPEELYDETPKPIRRAFGRPISAELIEVTMPASAEQPTTGTLAWRTDACAHLDLTSGHCPDGARQILVSTADAENFGWSDGTEVRVLEVQPDDARQRPIEMSLTVSGTYRQPRDAYWDTWTVTGLSGTKPERNAAVQHDLWVTDRATFVQQPTWRNPSSRADMVLRQELTGVDDLLGLGDRIDSYARDQSHRPVLSALVTVRSELPAVADAVREAQDQARVTIPALMAPLGVLGLVVLWMALGTAVEQRRPEVAVARLRGRGVRGAQLHLVRELLATVLLGVPVGVVLAYAVSWPARHLLLPGSVPWEVRGPVWVALVLSVVVLSATVALVTTGVVREPIVALLRRIPARRPGWGLGTADAVVVTVSALILASFATGRLTGPVALVAPAVLALGAGLVLARAVVPVAARLGHLLLGRGASGSGVGLLNLARRPGIRASTALLTVAAAILVFAGDAVAVGARTREVAAAQRVGAPLVVTVAGDNLPALRRALDSAGVSERDVTPVVVQPGVVGADQTVLYVDAAHFGSIGSFADGSTARAALDKLSVPSVDPIRVTGTSLSVGVSTDGFYEGTEQPVGLEVVLLRADGTLLAVPLGTLPAGSAPSSRATAAVDCASTCTLTGWKVTTSPANAGTGRIVLSDLRAGTSPVSLGVAEDWRGVPSGESKLGAVGADARSLTVFVDNAGASELLLSHRWVPATLPAVVTGSLPPGSEPARFAAHGLDGVNRPMEVAGRLPWLPSTGRNAAITDLALAERSGSLLSSEAVQQLWFSRDDPALLGRTRAALADAGLDVASVTRTSEVRRELDDSAATWSLELGVLVGIACLLVAVLGLAIAAAGAWRGRSRDLAVLRLNGLAVADLRRISVIEQLPTTVAGVVVGVVAGVIAAHYALPTLPLLPADPPVDLVDLSTAWGVVLALAALAVVVLGTFGWAAARAVSSAAAPTPAKDRA